MTSPNAKHSSSTSKKQTRFVLGAEQEQLLPGDNPY